MCLNLWWARELSKQLLHGWKKWLIIITFFVSLVLMPATIEFVRVWGFWYTMVVLRSIIPFWSMHGIRSVGVDSTLFNIQGMHDRCTSFLLTLRIYHETIAVRTM